MPRRPCVLVVEDEPQLLAMYARILEASGFEVCRASDGKDALEHLAGLPYTPVVVVTDVRMPSMDGVELGARVQQRVPGLPVLYLSGFAADELPLSEEVRARCFLPKPFPPEVLLRRVQDLCGLEPEPVS